MNIFLQGLKELIFWLFPILKTDIDLVFSSGSDFSNSILTLIIDFILFILFLILFIYLLKKFIYHIRKFLANRSEKRKLREKEKKGGV